MILHNGESLAYIGDAIYELKIREYLLEKGYQDVNKLHKYAVKFTSGERQALIIDYLIKNDVTRYRKVVKELGLRK